MIKHTLGPWEIVEHSWSRTGIYAKHIGIAALDISGDADETNQAEWEALMSANARLIAAAPDLLEALLSIDVYLSDTLSGRVNPDPKTYKRWLIDGIIEVRNRARAAIAKATGENT